MRTLGEGNARTGSGVSRRDFIRVGGLGAAGLALTDPWARAAKVDGLPKERAVIFLMLVGGPSQLETWDPKPDAPAEVCGPFRSIATAVPGVRISEHLPRLARRADRLALVRSLYHEAAPIHETGQQLIQTGKLCRLGQEHPHVGAAVAKLKAWDHAIPPFVLLPGAIGNTGVGVSHGQTAGALGSSYEPFSVGADPGAAGYDPSAVADRAGLFLAETAGTALSTRARRAFDLNEEREAVRDAYGRNRFGQSCLLARRLVEAGARVVTVNMFETVFNRVSWDCHGARPFSTLDDYRRELLPALDAALSALIDDLELTGRLDSTLVVAAGEFGRTPRINSAGGRDHWPGVWSAALAGGGVRGGQVIGASDAHAAAPADRPVTPPELLATIYQSLGIDQSAPLALADGTQTLIAEGVSPIAEAFA
jgi:uncharacterized protein (DUF1501 family)